MNIGDFFTLAPKLLPLMPRIEKAIATVQALEKNDAVQDALAVAKEVALIFEQSGIKS
jgi:hypothetical protein